MTTSKKQLQKTDIITVKARRWTDSFANTYHCVKIWVNDDLIGSNPFAYGYEEGYIQTAAEILWNAYERPKDFTSWHLWPLRGEYVEQVNYSAIDVKRKKDLNF